MSAPVEILFDQPIFHPGETVSGSVLFHFKTPTKVSNVKLTWVGRCRTQWTDNPTPKYRKSLYRSETESYLNEEISLISTEEFVEPGRSIPFSQALPTKIPSSFSGLYGGVEYFVKIEIKRPWSMMKTFKAAFKVEGEEDLNDWGQRFNQEVRVDRSSVGDFKFVALRHFWDSPFGVELKLSRVGYTVGESVPFSLTVSNESEKPIKQIKVSLVQEVGFIVNLPSQVLKSIETNVLETVTLDGIEPSDSRNMDAELAIPDGVPPTSLGGCRIIDLDYYLAITLEGPYFTDTVDTRLKILVGTKGFETETPVEGVVDGDLPEGNVVSSEGCTSQNAENEIASGDNEAIAQPLAVSLLSVEVGDAKQEVNDTSEDSTEPKQDDVEEKANDEDDAPATNQSSETAGGDVDSCAEVEELKESEAEPTHEVSEMSDNTETTPENEAKTAQVVSEVQATPEVKEVEETPVAKEAEETPEAKEIEQTPLVVEAEETPEVEAEETPEVNEVEETPQVQEPETTEVAEVKATPAVNEVEETPEVKEAEETPEAKEIEQTPLVVEAEETPEVQAEETPEVNETEETPQVKEDEKTPQAKEIGETTEVGEAAETPETPKVYDEEEPPEIKEAEETTEVEAEESIEVEDVNATPAVNEMEETPEIKETEETAEAEEVKETPEVEKMPHVNEAEETPGANETEETQKVTEVEETPEEKVEENAEANKILPQNHDALNELNRTQDDRQSPEVSNEPKDKSDVSDDKNLGDGNDDLNGTVSAENTAQNDKKTEKPTKKKPRNRGKKT